MDEKRGWVRRLADREIFELVEEQTGLQPDQLIRARKLRHAIRHTSKAVLEVKDVDAPGGVDPSKPLRARVLDMSEGGAALFTKFDLRVGSRLKLGVVIYDGQVIESEAEVRWSNPKPAREGYAIGLQFAKMDEKNIKRLGTYLTELTATLGM